MNWNSSSACASTLHVAKNHSFGWLFESDKELDKSTEVGGQAEQHSEGSSEELNATSARGRQNNKCESSK